VLTVLRHARACAVEAWRPVVEARAAFDLQRADRLTRKILGVVEPMSEEAKAKLKAYAEEHKDEIREKAKAKRQLRRRMLALTKTTRR
jgi:hypothetical protein